MKLEEDCYLKVCETCGHLAPVHCVECELPLVNNLRSCPACVEAWRMFMLPATCTACGGKGVQGEMVQRPTGFLCDTCCVVGHDLAIYEMLTAAADQERVA